MLFSAAALAISLVVGRGDLLRARRLERWVFLAFPVCFVLVYAALTREVRANNFLPVIPFSSLLAAWGAIRGWSAVARRLPGPGCGWVATAAVTLLVAWVAPRPFLYAYHVLVPTTLQQAATLLESRFGSAELREVVYERATVSAWRQSRGESLGPLWPGRVLAADRLDRLPPRRLDRADAEIFLLERLEEEGQEVYLRRIAEASIETYRIQSRRFQVTGPDLGVVLHPWRASGGPEPLEIQGNEHSGRRGVSVVSPGWRTASADAISVSVRVPEGIAETLPQVVAVAGRRAPLETIRHTGDGFLLLTPRIAPPPSGDLVVELPGWSPKVVEPAPEISLHRWRRPR